jgi:RecJ-like exonuclease
MPEPSGPALNTCPMCRGAGTIMHFTQETILCAFAGHYQSGCHEEKQCPRCDGAGKVYAKRSAA